MAPCSQTPASRSVGILDSEVQARGVAFRWADGMLIAGKQICHVSTCSAEECNEVDGCQRRVLTLKAVSSPSHTVIAGTLAAEIKEVLHKHDGVPLALAIGVLRIVEAELIAEAGVI